MSIRALIFDFDGLILETEAPDFQSWQETFEERGVCLTFETWAPFIGQSAGAFDPYAHLETQLGRPVDRAALRVGRRRRFLELVEAQPLREGVLECLNTARRVGLRLAVASSSDRAWVEGHLGRRGILDYFHALHCREDVEFAKPNPALYLRALRQLDMAASEAIAFEDSPNGIRAAKRAGLYCVAVPNPMTAALLLDEADLRLDSLGALCLEALLAQL